MRLYEFEDTFGVKTLPPTEIAKMHGVSIDQILSQLKKGIRIEMEHTKDEHMAMEIALDHLKEFPDYYDRLERVER